MKTRMRMAAWIGSVSLVVVSVPFQKAAAVRDLFEEAEPRERSGLPGLGNLQEQGKALAKQVVEKVNKSYYNVSEHCAGFDAVYTVEEGAQPAGKITVCADFTREKPFSVTFEGRLSRDELKDVVVDWTQTAWIWLVVVLPPGNLAATESEEGFLIVDLSPKAQFKEARMVVSKDHRLTQELLVHKDGPRSENRYQVQTIDGKHYPDSVEIQTVAAPVTVTTTLLYTYTRVEGVVLIKKLGITTVVQHAQAGTEEKTELVLKLDEATLKKQAAPEATEIARPKTPANWDALSAQVIPQMIESNWDVVRYIQSAKCMVDISYRLPNMSPITGKLSYAWEDANNDGMISEVEVSIETVEDSNPLMRQMINDFQAALTQFTTGTGFGSFFQRTATARKTAEGYEITLKTQEGTESPVRVTVSGDFRSIRLETQGTHGGQVNTTYSHAKVADKWLLKEFTIMMPPGPSWMFTTTDRWTLTYDWQHGAPLVAKIEVFATAQSAAGRSDSRRTFVMNNWEVVKRPAPFDYQLGTSSPVQPTYPWLRETTP